jgi:hypothetical protein
LVYPPPHSEPAASGAGTVLLIACAINSLY